MSSEARAALKAAAEQVSALDAEIASLERAAERAKASAEEATAELRRHEQLDKQITAWRVHQMKAAKQTRTLPAELKSLVDARRGAIEEQEQAESTLAAIEEELEGLRKKRSRAESAKKAAAVDVLHEMSNPLIEELITINRRRAELVQLLHGLSEVKAKPDAFGNPSRIGVPRAGWEAASSPFNFEFNPNALPIEEVTARWTQRLEALCADPDAAVAIPKHVEPSDYLPGTGKRAGTGPQPVFLPGSWRLETT